MFARWNRDVACPDTAFASRRRSRLPQLALGCGVGALLLSVAIAMTGAPARAQGRTGGVPAEVAALQAQLQALENRVAELEAGQNTDEEALSDRVAALEQALADESAARAAEVAALQQSLADESAARAAAVAALQQTLNTVQTQQAIAQTLLQWFSWTPNGGGADIYLTRANLHIRNGSDTTSYTNGLGNLIIGYNEPLPTAQRSGSHNLVVGPGHSYASYGGMVLGVANSSLAPNSSVLGGGSNLAVGSMSVVVGGLLNYASGDYSSVLGGYQNRAEGDYSTVSGGQFNRASGRYSSVSGGRSGATTDTSGWTVGLIP